jgi:hypothetical protein
VGTVFSGETEGVYILQAEKGEGAERERERERDNSTAVAMRAV